MFKKFLCLMLSLVSVFSVAGCKNEEPSATKNSSEAVKHTQSPGLKETLRETDIDLIANGATEYKIVIPETAGISVKFAAEEIAYFVKNANGCNMPIITDRGLSFNENDKYISVGPTKIAEGSGLTVSMEEVGLDGFKIKTYANTVVLLAYQDNGHTNAAYGWLERNLDYHYYYYDEWVINTSKNIKLVDMDVTEKPTFSGRYLSYFPYRMSGSAGTDYDLIRYQTRAKTTGGQGGAPIGRTAMWANNNDQSMESQIWTDDAVGVTQTHTQTGEQVRWRTIDTQYTQATGVAIRGQLCLSTMIDGLSEGKELLGNNEMFTHFATSFINKSFSQESDNIIFFLGINDNWDACQCAECAAYYAAIKQSGLMLKFVNELSRVAKRWLNDEFNGVTFEFPDYVKNPSYQFVDSPEGDENREYYLGFFAYNYTTLPPANYNEETQSYEPVDDVKTVYDKATGTFRTESLNRKLLGDDEVMVRIAPIESNNMYVHMDTNENPTAAAAFAGWGSVVDHLTVWDYGCNFTTYLAPYPDWGTMQENFLMYEEQGVFDVFTQLTTFTEGVMFMNYNAYMRCQLMWNAHQDVEALKKDFFEHYYQDAAPYMEECFDYVQARYEQMKVIGGHALQATPELQGYDGYIYSDVLYNCWTFEGVLRMKDYLDKAFAAIEKYKTLDIKKYEKLNKRLVNESMYYQYLLIEKYSDWYTTTELSDMISNFKADALMVNVMTVYSGGTGDIATLISNWTQKKL